MKIKKGSSFNFGKAIMVQWGIAYTIVAYRILEKHNPNNPYWIEILGAFIIAIIGLIVLGFALGDIPVVEQQEPLGDNS